MNGVYDIDPVRRRARDRELRLRIDPLVDQLTPAGRFELVAAIVAALAADAVNGLRDIAARPAHLERIGEGQEAQRKPLPVTTETLAPREAEATPQQPTTNETEERT